KKFSDCKDLCQFVLQKFTLYLTCSLFNEFEISVNIGFNASRRSSEAGNSNTSKSKYLIAAKRWSKMSDMVSSKNAQAVPLVNIYNSKGSPCSVGESWRTISVMF